MGDQTTRMFLALQFGIFFVLDYCTVPISHFMKGLESVLKWLISYIHKLDSGFLGQNSTVWMISRKLQNIIYLVFRHLLFLTIHYFRFPV